MRPQRCRFDAPRGWVCIRNYHLDPPCALNPRWWNLTGRWWQR